MLADVNQNYFENFVVFSSSWKKCHSELSRQITEMELEAQLLSVNDSIKDFVPVSIIGLSNGNESVPRVLSYVVGVKRSLIARLDLPESRHGTAAEMIARDVFASGGIAVPEMDLISVSAINGIDNIGVIQ